MNYWVTLGRFFFIIAVIAVWEILGKEMQG